MKQIKVNVPIIAYTTVSFKVEVPDDFDGQLVSESNPSFSIQEIVMGLADRALDKVHGEVPEWEINELVVYSNDPYENLTGYIEWD